MGFILNHGVTSNVFLTSNELTQKILDKNLFNENINIIDIDKMDNNFLPNTNIVTIFDTQLPISYEAKLTNKNLLINYEYFSAEQWVDGYHLKESINKKYKKIFYIPGVCVRIQVFAIFAKIDKGLYGTEKLKGTNTTSIFFAILMRRLKIQSNVLREATFRNMIVYCMINLIKHKNRGKNSIEF